MGHTIMIDTIIKEPQVSVVVTLYNYEKYISDCIRSILKQDYKNIELIVIDDCSTDNSYAIAKSFKSNNVKVVRLGKNSGYSTCKNEGIIRSKGEYIALLDADDMMTKNSVSVRVKQALKKNANFVHADAIAVYKNDDLKRCYRLKIKSLPPYSKKNRAKMLPSILHFPTAYEIHAQTVLIHRDVYKRYGLYEEKLRSCSDREMWYRLLGRSQKDVPRVNRSHVAVPVAYYRYHNKSMTHYRYKHKDYNKQVHSFAKKCYNIRKNKIDSSNTRMWTD